MSRPRIKTGFWARALLRQHASSGQPATVLQRGDEDAGAAFIVLFDGSDRTVVLKELPGEASGWERRVMEDAQALRTYLDRQCEYDPDLWILELNVQSVDTLIEKTLPGRYG